MKKLYLYCCFLMLFSLLGAQSLVAQHQVSGKVVDVSNEPIVGVNIVEKGTSHGVITDVNGNYSIEVSDGDAALVFSFIGFVNKEIPVNGQRTINVSLEESLAELDEIVVVGYGTQKKVSITGAVSQIDGEKLLNTPVGNITSKLGGAVPGVISLQQSGQPGADGAALLVRGSSAKYIVDGVERDFSEIDPNAIESVSVLKDASSAAIYGMDANAVIIVTTKRGEDKESRISFNAGYGISENTQMLDMLDGPEYAYWYNRAREMDGDQPVFSSEHVEMMQNGDHTDGWGNTNWYDKTFDIGINKNFNVNASGGNESITYFTSLGYFDQEGNVEGFNFDRINLRSNIDAAIAENLDLRFDISARVEDRNRPGFSANPGDWNNIPQQAIRAHPYAVEEIDGFPVSTRTASSYVNPIGAAERSGYNNIKGNIIQTNFSLNYEVPFVQGLQAKFMVAYDLSNQTSKSFSTPYYTYVANPPTTPDGDISYSYTYDPRGNTASLVEGSSKYTHLTTNASLRYDNQFGAHNISVLALLETIERDGNNFGAYGYGFDILELDELDFATLDDKTRVSGGSYMQRQAGVVGRLNYDYASKYLAELSFRYDGSYVFGGMNDRWGAFPAASLGWRISEESWFQNLDFVNNLKLRGGLGLTGTTEIPPYYYLNTLSFLNNPAVVINGEPQNGLFTSRPANKNLTWAKALQYNAGVDAIFWKGLLGVEFDVFYKYIYDMLSSVDATYPPSYGGYVPGYSNNNKQDHKGFEFSLSHRNSLGDFSYNINLNGTYIERRWLRYGDSPNTPDWLKLTGKEVGSQVGFIAEGLFQSQEEIDNFPLIPGKDVRVGDIKYKDRNGDGVITYEQDRGYIGKSSFPKFIGGFSFEGEWKNFDVSFLFQGALGRDVALTGVYGSGVMDNTSMTKPFYHGGNSPKYLVDNSWRDDNQNGEFPRLSVVTASSNNAYSSSFWYRNGDYLRIKNMQIGYTLPQRWMTSLGMNSLRFYVEGQNLLTFSELTKYNIDPEQPGVSNGYYPQQRIYSMGVKLTF